MQWKNNKSTFRCFASKKEVLKYDIIVEIDSKGLIKRNEHAYRVILEDGVTSVNEVPQLFLDLHPNIKE